MQEHPAKSHILPTIVLAQFLCTSLWFAGNAILPELLQDTLDGELGFLANLTNAVQFGFISGTLVFAILTIADRFSPSRVFFVSSVLAALFNLGISREGISTDSLLVFRYLTGFFLAGIYPVGMKIASDYYQKGLGKSLGFLVGALVLGTAFPHFLRSLAVHFPWQYVVFATSTFSFLGGLAILFLVPNGPFRKAGPRLEFTAFLTGFRHKNFRAVAFGYFGHMWELYTFWAFVPVILANYAQVGQHVSLYSFLIIASGGPACVLSGYLSQYFGAKRIATLALFLSGLCCLLSPWFLSSASTPLLLAFLFFWGVVVIADSPLFSSLVAQNVPDASRGTSLTIVNCIGFSITIVSIKLISAGALYFDHYLFMFLAIGPVLGLTALLKNKALSGN